MANENDIERLIKDAYENIPYSTLDAVVDVMYWLNEQGCLRTPTVTKQEAQAAYYTIALDYYFGNGKISTDRAIKIIKKLLIAQGANE